MSVLRAAATRERLYEAAIAEFKRAGVAASEIGPIASAAGVSRSNFYFHFDSKEQVLAELQAREEARIIDAVGSPSVDRPIVEVLLAVVDGVLDAQERLGPDLFRSMLAAQFAREATAEPPLRAFPLSGLVVDALAAAAVRGEVRTDFTVTELANAFMTGLFGLLISTGGDIEARRRTLHRCVLLNLEGMYA